MIMVKIKRVKGNNDRMFLSLPRKVRQRIQKHSATDDGFNIYTDKLYSVYRDFINCPIDKYYHDNMHLNESGQRRTKLDALLSEEWF
jgi:hypothetical protein